MLNVGFDERGTHTTAPAPVCVKRARVASPFFTSPGLGKKMHSLFVT